MCLRALRWIHFHAQKHTRRPLCRLLRGMVLAVLSAAFDAAVALKSSAARCLQVLFHVFFEFVVTRVCHLATAVRSLARRLLDLDRLSHPSQNQPHDTKVFLTGKCSVAEMWIGAHTRVVWTVPNSTGDGPRPQRLRVRKRNVFKPLFPENRIPYNGRRDEHLLLAPR